MGLAVEHLKETFGHFTGLWLIALGKFLTQTRRSCKFNSLEEPTSADQPGLGPGVRVHLGRSLRLWFPVQARSVGLLSVGLIFSIYKVDVKRGNESALSVFKALWNGERVGLTLESL